VANDWSEAIVEAPASGEDWSEAIVDGADSPNQFLTGLQAGLPAAKDRIGAGLEAIGKSFEMLGIKSLDIKQHPLTRLGQQIQKGEKGEIPEPRISKLEDVSSASDFFDFLSYNIANSIPSGGVSLATGAAGAGLGLAAGGPIGAAIGGRIGMAAGAELIAAGDVYLEAREKGVDAPTAALLAGIPIFLLDMITPMRAAGRLFGAAKDVAFAPVKKAAKDGLVKRVGKAAAEGFATESLTEAVQETIQAGAVSGITGNDFWTPELASRVLNAWAVGGAMGMGIGALTPSGPATARGDASAGPSTALSWPGDSSVTNLDEPAPVSPDTTPDMTPPPDLSGVLDPPIEAPVVVEETIKSGGSSEPQPVIPKPPPEPVVEDPASLEGLLAQSIEAAKTGQALEPKVVNSPIEKELPGIKPWMTLGGKRFELQFENDVEKAAYLASRSSRSERDSEYVDFVMRQTGMSEPEVRELGQTVRSRIQEKARVEQPQGKLRIPIKAVHEAINARNTVFHATNESGVLGILNTGEIQPSTRVPVPGVSVSRVPRVSSKESRGFSIVVDRSKIPGTRPFVEGGYGKTERTVSLEGEVSDLPNVEFEFEDRTYSEPIKLSAVREILVDESAVKDFSKIQRVRLAAQAKGIPVRVLPSGKAVHSYRASILPRGDFAHAEPEYQAAVEELQVTEALTSPKALPEPNREEVKAYRTWLHKARSYKVSDVLPGMEDLTSPEATLREAVPELLDYESFARANGKETVQGQGPLLEVVELQTETKEFLDGLCR
jgi:hypothetical protein